MRVLVPGRRVLYKGRVREILKTTEPVDISTSSRDLIVEQNHVRGLSADGTRSRRFGGIDTGTFCDLYTSAMQKLFRGRPVITVNRLAQRLRELPCVWSLTETPRIDGRSVDFSVMTENRDTRFR